MRVLILIMLLSQLTYARVESPKEIFEIKETPSSSISELSFKKLMNKYFKKMRFLNYQDTCPTGYTIRDMSNGINSIHCEDNSKEPYSHNLAYHENGKFMQYLLANSKSKGMETFMQVSFHNTFQEISLGNLGKGHGSCYDIRFNNYAVTKITVVEGHKEALENINVDYQKYGVRTSEVSKKIHNQSKQKILNILDELCATFGDDGACQIRKIADSINCGEKLY